jgi:hypothetical protein
MNPILIALRTALMRTGGGAGKTLKNVGKTAGKGSIFGGAAAGTGLLASSAGSIAGKLFGGGSTQVPQQEQPVNTVVEKQTIINNPDNSESQVVGSTQSVNEAQESETVAPALNIFEQIKSILESIKQDTSTVIKELDADEAREVQAAEKAESMRVEKETEDARKGFFKTSKELTNSVVQGVKSGISGLLKLLLGALLLDSLAKAFTGKGIKELVEEYFFQPMKDSVKEKVQNIGEATGLNNLFGGIKDFFGGIVEALNPNDNKSLLDGIARMNTGIAKFFDALVNPFAQFFGQKDLLQQGMTKLKELDAYIMSPKFAEDLDSIGTSIVNTFKKLGTDLKNAFSDPATMFPSLKSQERRINELKGSSFVDETRPGVIKQLIKEGKVEKKGFSTKYNELEPDEKKLVDKLVEEEREKAFLKVDPNFDIKKFREKEKVMQGLMDQIDEHSGNVPGLDQRARELLEEEKSAIITDGPTENETDDDDIPRIRVTPPPPGFPVPEAVPEKDADKISMGASMRNYAMDPKPLAMMAVTRNSPTSVNNNNSSTVVSNTTNVKKGGGGGSIGTRNADTSLYSGLTPAFMQGVRG